MKIIPQEEVGVVIGKPLIMITKEIKDSRKKIIMKMEIEVEATRATTIITTIKTSLEEEVGVADVEMMNNVIIEIGMNSEVQEEIEIIILEKITIILIIEIGEKIRINEGKY